MAHYFITFAYGYIQLTGLLDFQILLCSQMMGTSDLDKYEIRLHNCSFEIFLSMQNAFALLQNVASYMYIKMFTHVNIIVFLAII